MTNLLLALSIAIFSGPAAAESLKQAWMIAGLDAPESAYYDAGTDTVYISNVVGSPVDKDGRGWISKATPDGMLTAAQWVTGLNAPKGLRVAKGVLYVADIDELVSVELATGRILKKVKAPGAKLLNDVVVSPEGRIYVSDTLGSKIYVFPPSGPAQVFAEGDALESPNGLYFRKGRLYVAAWGLAAADWSTKMPGRLYAVRLKDRKMEPITVPFGNLDGIELINDTWLVSDWMAGKVFAVTRKGKVKTVLSGLGGAADLGYVPSRRLLLVPRMKENQLSAYDVSTLK